MELKHSWVDFICKSHPLLSVFVPTRLQKAVKKNATDDEAWYFFGLALIYQSKKAKDAAKAFETVIKLRPKFAACSRHSRRPPGFDVHPTRIQLQFVLNGQAS